MIPDAELDPILTTWLSGPGHRRAPDGVLAGALAQVAEIEQRRPAFGLGRARLFRRAPRERRAARRPAVRLAVAAGLLVAVLVALAVGVGSAFRREQAPPSPSAGPSASSAAPSSPPSPGDTAWSQRSFPDLGFSAELPASWKDADAGASADRIVLVGTDPPGTLSVSHASPFDFSLCTPTCVTEAIPQRVPFSAEATIADVKAAISDRVGSSDWKPIADGVVAGLSRAFRLDVVISVAGTPQRRVYLAGLDPERIVVLTWTQPAASWDETIVERTIAGLRVRPDPTYSIGKLVPVTDPNRAYELQVPDFWPGDQVSNGQPIAGLRRFGEGELIVSFATPFARLGICDPECREVAGQNTLADLRTTLRTGAAGDWDLERIELGGEPAELLRQTNPARPALEHRYGIHDGRAFLVTIDLSSGLVARSAFDEILASFRFLPPPEPDTSGPRLTSPDGSFSIQLSKGFTRRGDPDPNAIRAVIGLPRVADAAVYAGNESGQIRRCDRPAAPWEECDPVRARTLDELREATAVKPIADHGAGPPVGKYDEVLLDGERALVVHIQAYEHPARGGQEVIYVLAMHDGRPFIIRLWTSHNEFFGEEDIIAGFRFET